MLQPRVMGKWLVIFCDECNLPAADKYGTQRVITFLRQLVEQNGFVGACHVANFVETEQVLVVPAQ